LRYFFNGSVFLGNSNVPHPLPNCGNGRHGHHLVKLPSRWILSDQTAVSEGGDGWFCTRIANHQNA
jgi:hypothetical protein